MKAPALALACGLLLAAGLPARPLLLDPGHGGADAGVSLDGLKESELTLDLARRVEALLKARGVEVRKTRDKDEALGLGRRVELADSLQPAAVLSLHLNASHSPAAAGPRLFVAPAAALDEPAAPRWEQAAARHAAASRALGQSLAKALGLAGPRGVQAMKLGLFRGLDAPACLVEVGFATHGPSLKALKSEPGRQALAEKLAAGVADWLEKEKP